MALDPPLSFTRAAAHQQGTTTSSTPFAASPVIRLSSCPAKPSSTTHSILTIPGQGWSIYNTLDQSILSSQKLPPTVTLHSPCFSFSIPNQPIHPTESKPRSRFIYAPIASCPSDPASNRTIWVWIENEASRGFGERSDTTTVHPNNSASANLVKTFPDPIQCVYPIPPNPDATASPQLARILVLLQTGALHLTDQHLTTLKTCSINLPPGIPPSLQDSRHCIQFVQPSSQLSSGRPIVASGHQHQLIYLARCKPKFQTTPATPANSRSSNKRKSSQNQPSAPTSPRFSHYCHVEIHVLKLLGSDQLEPLAQLSDIRDFLDLTISPQGWITILEPSRVLSTFCLSDVPNSKQQSSSPRLTLLPHPQCGPIKLAISPQSDSNSTSSLAPSLVTLPSSLPLVLMFTSHPNQPNTCLGLVLDLYHQAVLHVLQFAWPTPPKTVQSVSGDQAPQSISTSLSSSDHLFMCLSYKSLFVLQVLHPPQFSLDQPPTWVEILDPVVKQATLDWIVCKADSQAQLTSHKTILLSESIASSNLFPLSSSKSKKEGAVQHETLPVLSKSLQLFVERFNQIWMGGAQSSPTGRWDPAASRAAELAWIECFITPTTERLLNKKKSKQSTQHPEDHVMKSAEKIEPPKPTLPEATLLNTLRLVLPKVFVEVLLSMCLGSFAESEDPSQPNEPDQEGANKKTASAPYPGEIVQTLLKTGLVDDKMVRGGVIRALRKTQDVSMVQLGIARMIYVRESELVETIHWVIQHSSLPTTANGIEASTNHQLEYCLAKVVGQALDPNPLRKAIRSLLSTLDAIAVLNTLLVWIEWWTDFGESSLGTSVKKTPENPLISPTCLKRSEIPELAKIYEFLGIVLDSKLVELITFNHNNSHHDSDVFRVLKSIQVNFITKIREDLVLQSLDGSLAQFTKLVRVQKLKLRAQKTQVGQRQKTGRTPFNPKYQHVNSKVVSIPPTPNPTASKKKKPGKNTSSVKISNLAATNLTHFVDYSIEKFTL